MEVLLSLGSGLAIAATVQLLLTNLGIALGLTVLDWSPSDVAAPDLDTDEALPPSEGSFPVTHLLGAGVALTLSVVLFVAALLATEFSPLVEPRRGAIFGIILWSVYWLLFLWLSSTTLSSLANSVLGTAIAGGRRLFTTLRQTWRSPSPREADIAPMALRELAAELSQVRELREQLPTLLDQQRETLIQEISDRTDLSPQQAESVVDDIEAQPVATTASPLSQSPSSLLSQLDLPNWRQVVQQVLDQVDLSDWDAETLWHRAQALLESKDEDEAAPAPVEVAASAVVQDAEDYVRHSPTWALQPAVLQREFYQRLYDAEAAPAAIQEQVSQLARSHYLDWLRSRGDVAAAQVEAIADHLTQVQNSVMTAVTAASDHPDHSAPAAPSPPWPDLEAKLLAYLRYTNLELLTPANLTAKIQAVQADTGFEPPTLKVTSAHLTPLTAVLSRRHGLAPERQQALQHVLYTSLLTEESGEASDLSDRLGQLTQLLQNTLGPVDWSAVSLEDLKPALRHQLRSLDWRGDIDWQALRAQLQLPKETQTALVDWLQEVGQDLSRPPRRWANRVGHSTHSWAEQLTHEVTQYLQFQEKSALRPEHMAKDVIHVLKRGLRLLPSPTDWPNVDDLRDLFDLGAVKTALENRRDLTVDEIQQIVNWFEAAWQQASQQVEDWSSALWQLARDRFTPQAETLDAAREQVVERIAAAQTAVQTRATDLKADVQRQADAARRQVAIAAWWLFLSLLSSGGAAAIAGWLAVKY